MRIEDKVKKFIDKPDLDYYLSRLNSAGANKFPLEQKKEIISNVIAVCEQFKDELRRDFGEDKQPAFYAQMLGVDVVYIEEKDSFAHNYIGNYSLKKKQISINMFVLNKIISYIRENSLENLIDERKIGQTVIAHELFHAMQAIHPDTYVDTAMFPTKIFGFIKVKTKLSVLEEIGAVHFSKILTDLPFNPLVFNKIYSFTGSK